MNPTRSFDGTEWEARIQVLLKARYPAGDYQEVPDRAGGDDGIDGFSRDGVVYQCYAAEEPRSVEELYEVQRDKLSRDIKKFIDNKNNAVSALIGTVLVRKWLLVVPRHEAAELIVHANRKAKEVRDACLPYVSDDFQIGVITDAEFAPELQRLGMAGVKPPPLSFTRAPKAADVWEQDPGVSPLLTNIVRKSSQISGLSDGRRRVFQSDMIQHYLEGQAVLDELREKMPAVYAEVVNVKLSAEKRLRTRTALSEDTPKAQIRDLLGSIKGELERTVSAFRSDDADGLAHEAVADWLLRCPLDFDPAE